MSMVDILDFSYTYPGEKAAALKDIHFTIEQGEFVVIAGPSGSGKSTLGKAMAGFLFQDEQPEYSGEIIVNQTDMSQVPLYQASQRVAYVQQNPEDQFCTLSVLDEIAFALENACLQPEEMEKRIDEALGIVVGLDLRDRLLSSLSGGEKQKVAIATMLALSPDVLILDEPTSNLDPNATQYVFETLHALRRHTDLTVVIIEHKLSQLEDFNPRVIFLEEGRIVLKTHLQQRLPEPPISKILQHPVEKVSSKHSNPIIDISHLYVHLGGQEILQDISLTLYPGEFTAIMGPNGSGKSTLLLTIMGIYKPEHGSILGLNKNLTQAKTSTLVPDVGFIFQNPDHQLFTQSVWDEVTLTIRNLDFLDDDYTSTATELLSEIGLLEKRDDHPQRLSYGEKRRLNLAAAILHNPKLLLIDELLIGQDMHNAHKWMGRLKQYTAEGHTILLVNHHAALTQSYCDRVIFLDGGRKIIDAPVASAFNTLADQGFQAFLPQRQEGCMYA